MLALFAELVENHPSCRVSRRHHWPGPHHHKHHATREGGQDCMNKYNEYNNDNNNVNNNNNNNNNNINNNNNNINDDINIINNKNKNKKKELFRPFSLTMCRRTEDDDAAAAVMIKTPPSAFGHRSARGVFLSPAQSSRLELLTSPGTWLNQTNEAKSFTSAEITKTIITKEENNNNNNNNSSCVGVNSFCKSSLENVLELTSGVAAAHSPPCAVHDSGENIYASGAPNREEELKVKEEVNEEDNNKNKNENKNVPFCLYERRQRVLRSTVADAGKKILSFEEIFPTPSSFSPCFYYYYYYYYQSHPCSNIINNNNNGEQRSELDDSYHNDKEAFDAMTISTTSSCVFGAGLAGLSWSYDFYHNTNRETDNNNINKDDINNNNNNNDNDNNSEDVLSSFTSHSEAVAGRHVAAELRSYHAERIIYAAKVQAKEQNAALLSEYVNSCRNGGKTCGSGFPPPQHRWKEDTSQEMMMMRPSRNTNEDYYYYCYYYYSSLLGGKCHASKYVDNNIKSSNTNIQAQSKKARRNREIEKWLAEIQMS